MKCPTWTKTSSGEFGAVLEVREDGLNNFKMKIGIGEEVKNSKVKYSALLPPITKQSGTCSGRPSSGCHPSREAARPQTGLLQSERWDVACASRIWLRRRLPSSLIIHPKTAQPSRARCCILRRKSQVLDRATHFDTVHVGRISASAVRGISHSESSSSSVECVGAVASSAESDPDSGECAPYHSIMLLSPVLRRACKSFHSSPNDPPLPKLAGSLELSQFRSRSRVRLACVTYPLGMESEAAA
jgi:hypothetical protein